MNPNRYLIVETLVVFVVVSALAVYLGVEKPLGPWTYVFYIPVLAFQGLWFYRFYIVGHEASHKKLFANQKTKNDFWGTVILLPLLTPINVYCVFR